MNIKLPLLLLFFYMHPNCLFVYIEPVAKLASRAKFSDFFVGSIICKVTYPFGHRHFANDRTNEKSANLAPNGVLQLAHC
jgi:hypothetical protein